MVQVLYSLKGILQLAKEGRWDVNERMAHFSRPGDIVSLAAVYGACNSFTKQIMDLLREPVVIFRPKVTHQHIEYTFCTVVAHSYQISTQIIVSSDHFSCEHALQDQRHSYARSCEVSCCSLWRMLSWASTASS